MQNRLVETRENDSYFPRSAQLGLEVVNTRILNHPNVVRVEDAGFSRGVFFLAA